MFNSCFSVTKMLQLSVASTCCASQEEQNCPGGVEEATAQSNLPVQPEEPQYSIEFSTSSQTDGEWNASSRSSVRLEKSTMHAEAGIWQKHNSSQT